MTKEELKEYIHIKQEKEQLHRLLKQLEAEEIAPAIQKLTGMPHNPSGPKSTVEIIAERRMELMERYRRMIADLDAKQMKIEAAIESLEGRERTLMRHKYIEGMKWNEVCEAEYYGWDTVHRIHRSALDKLAGVSM